MSYSREFLKEHNVFRYRMKKIEDMSECEVSRVCHWFCEENNLASEFKDFIQQMNKEKGIRYCLCVQESIDANRCNTIQMIAKQLIDPSDCQDCILNATRFPLSAVNASSVGSKGERRPSVNTADTNEVTFYMKIREYLKSLSLANPQITFAPDFEHYRIYEDFVCDRKSEEGVDHPGEYSGQASIKLVCSQHPFSLLEQMSDPRGCEKKQRAYTQEWVEYLKSEKLPVKEIHVCSAVDQNVFDALCCQDTLESLRIKWLRCKQIDEIVRLKNLKKLFLERASSLLDISPIVSLENLEVLILGETKKITDYSALSALKKLKVLGICVYSTSTNVTIKVKDLDFISEMPNLEYVDFMDVRLI